MHDKAMRNTSRAAAPTARHTMHKGIAGSVKTLASTQMPCGSASSLHQWSNKDMTNNTGACVLMLLCAAYTSPAPGVQQSSLAYLHVWTRNNGSCSHLAWDARTMICSADCTMVCMQQSLLTVLKESFKVYKAISEGLINLADRYFEMEYLDAHKGLEVYKESIVANDRLQQYYQQIEQIEELRRAIQFPKLESPPADFLTQMEAYAKEAPRPYDESSGGVSGSKKVSRHAVCRCAQTCQAATPVPAVLWHDVLCCSVTMQCATFEHAC